MVYIVMILWAFMILLEASANYLRIKKLEGKNRRGLVHWIWFIPRAIVGVGYLFWFISLDYTWYWTGIFLLSTHALLFPELLNLFRKKGLGYLGDPDLNSRNKSIYDKFIQKTIKYTSIWLILRLIFFLFGVGNMILMGHCSWMEINNGLCY